MMDDRENTPVVGYGPVEDDNEYYYFFRVCPKCGRYVKADERSKAPGYQTDPNATCKRCGRVLMVSAGWDYDEVDDAYAAHLDIYG